MTVRVDLPALGENVTEGLITRWLKRVGDTVVAEEPLLEVATDKVDTEIPAPFAGTIRELLAQENDTVPVGEPLALIEPTGADAGIASQVDTAPGPSTPPLAPSTPPPPAPEPAPVRVPA